MEQSMLINEAAQLINRASTAQGVPDENQAKTCLLNLQKLLNDNLTVPPPAEPEKPDEPLST